MLLQSLSALCKAPGGAGSIWKYLEALVRATGVSGRFAHGFRTELHFADLRGYRRNHRENLGLKRMSCASQLTIPDTARRSPDPACKYTDTRSLQPNQTSHTRDFSYLLVSSI